MRSYPNGRAGAQPRCEADLHSVCQESENRTETGQTNFRVLLRENNKPLNSLEFRGLKWWLRRDSNPGPID